MKIEDVPFCTIDWSKIEPTKHLGVTGEAYWRTFHRKWSQTVYSRLILY